MKKLANAVAMLKAYEGNFTYMYLDSRGLVTVGVGFLLKTAHDATRFTFWKNQLTPSAVHPCEASSSRRHPLPVAAGLAPATPRASPLVTGVAQLRTATHIEITQEWNNIKSKPHGYLASHYRPFATMSMSQLDIDAHLVKNIGHFEAKARHLFADWDKFPSDAQLALLDMLYNLGSLHAFPTLVTAAKAKDWTACANECHRSGPNQQRNEDTQIRFLSAAKEQPFVPRSFSNAPHVFTPGSPLR